MKSPSTPTTLRKSTRLRSRQPPKVEVTVEVLSKRKRPPSPRHADSAGNGDAEEAAEDDELAPPPTKARKASRAAAKPRTPPSKQKATKPVKAPEAASAPARTSSFFSDDDDLEVLGAAPLPTWPVKKPARARNVECVDASDIANARKAILGRVTGRRPPAKLVGLDEQFEKIHDLLERTIRRGESNSMLLVGSTGTGKSVVLDRALEALREEHTPLSNRSGPERVASKLFYEIRLDGYVHTDDRAALRDTVRQLCLEREMESKQLGSFADCFAAILETLRSGSENSIPIVFILDRFEMFVDRSSQTLLYNLFDVVQTSATPVAVVGLTCQIDATERLEKRVKSRFSHRHVYFHPLPDQAKFLELIRASFGLSVDDEVSEAYRGAFNEAVKETFEEPSVVKYVRKVFLLGKGIQSLQRIMYDPVHRLATDSPFLDAAHIIASAKGQLDDCKVDVVKSLSILELSLLVSIKHHEARHIDAFNFEMVYEEYRERFRRGIVKEDSLKSLVFVKSVAMK
ncbi:origin recognition complex subunit 4 C-terminus-domain-containing protein, partial [Blyttiomyces helicus]